MPRPKAQLNRRVFADRTGRWRAVQRRNWITLQPIMVVQVEVLADHGPQWVEADYTDVRRMEHGSLADVSGEWRACSAKAGRGPRCADWSSGNSGGRK